MTTKRLDVSSFQRHLFLSIVSMVGSISFGGCGEATNYFGVVPYNEQTNLGTMPEIEFRMDMAVPDDLPEPTESSVGLYLLPELTPVTVSRELDRSAGIFRLIPHEPLQPNRRYVAIGVALAALETPHYALPEDFAGRNFNAVTSYFETGSSPRGVMIWISHHPDHYGRIGILFSQPMTLDSITSRSLELTCAEGAMSWDRIDADPSYPGLVFYLSQSTSSLAADSTSSCSSLQAQLSPQLRAVNGTYLDGNQNFVGGETDDGQKLMVVDDPYLVDMTRLSGQPVTVADTP